MVILSACDLLRVIPKSMWEKCWLELETFAKILLDDKVIKIIIHDKAIGIYFSSGNEKITLDYQNPKYEKWVQIIKDYVSENKKKKGYPTIIMEVIEKGNPPLPEKVKRPLLPTLTSESVDLC